MCSSVLPQHPKCFKAAEPDQPHNNQCMHHPAHTNDSHFTASSRVPYIELLPREVTLINAEKLQYHKGENTESTLIPLFSYMYLCMCVCFGFYRFQETFRCEAIKNLSTGLNARITNHR